MILESQTVGLGILVVHHSECPVVNMYTNVDARLYLYVVCQAEYECSMQ